MEPITTAVMISGLVTYIGTQLAKNESVKKLFNDCTDTTVGFVDSLLFKPDGTEKEALQSLKENPTSKARQKKLTSEFEIALEEDKNAPKAIQELFDKISKTEEGGKIVTTITNSKNVITGSNITAGGNITIGDTNPISQHHTGSGDNIARDKVIHHK